MSRGNSDAQPAQPDEPTGSAVAQVTWPVRSGAVPPLADVFSARSETVPNLSAALAPGATVVLAPALAGGGAQAKGRPGATGKTQLAVAAAEGLLRSGGIELLVWITATSQASVLAGYVEASVAVQGVPPAGDSESVAMRFVQWLKETSRRWLMVFDDLTDAAHLDGLWPAGPAGTVLVTTVDAAAVPGSRHTVIPVGVFSTREALDYLMGRLTADPDQRLGGLDLIEKLGHDPLALAQATAVIGSSMLSCRDYQDRFLQRQLQLTRQGGSQPPPTTITWTLCLDRADHFAAGHTTAQFLLLLAALLDGHEIPGSFFAAQATCDYLAQVGGAQQADPQLAWNGVVNLERVGLLSTDSGGSRAVRISALVQEAVRAVIPEQVLNRAVRVAAAALLEIWPEQEPLPWLAGDLRSCAASLQRIAGEALWSGGCHPLLVRAGRSLDNARLTGPAVAYWSELAATSDRILGAAHPDTLQLMQRLAMAYLAAGRPEQAVPAFQQTLADSARALGPQHPAIARLRIDLGRALVAAGELRDAVTVLGDVAAGWERSHGQDDPGTLRAWDDYAAACMTAEQFSEAVKSYRRTLAERERIQGARHPDTISARQNLADACLADGQFKLALNEHKRAVADRERVAGRDHPDALAARTRLASAYLQADRATYALQMFELVRADSERVLGADHPDTLARCATLADIYDSAGLLSDAQRLLEDTARRCERVLPPGDPLTQAVQESLARVAGR